MKPLHPRLAKKPPAPENDTRVFIIPPKSGQEFRSPIYLVGCAPGQSVLEIESDGEILAAYRFTVLDPS